MPGVDDALHGRLLHVRDRPHGLGFVAGIAPVTLPDALFRLGHAESYFRARASVDPGRAPASQFRNVILVDLQASIHKYLAILSTA